MDLTFVTSNKAKAEELACHLDYPVSHQKLDLPEIQSLDLAEIATKKAGSAYKLLSSPVLVEDISLVFHSLHTLPGPFIRWFLESLGNEGLVKLLADHDDRSCIAAVCFALADETGVHIFTSTVTGQIAAAPRGERGFGWDPIFIPDGHTKTWGEMDPTERTETSMRKGALTQLKVFLDQAE